MYMLEFVVQENLNATATHPASCQEYFDRGESQNATYTIKPTLNEHSFKVFCEFSNSTGYTIIKPVGFNESGEIYPKTNADRCKDPECFSETIDYGINIEQLKV